MFLGRRRRRRTGKKEKEENKRREELVGEGEGKELEDEGVATTITGEETK